MAGFTNDIVETSTANGKEIKLDFGRTTCFYQFMKDTTVGLSPSWGTQFDNTLDSQEIELAFRPTMPYCSRQAFPVSVAQ